MTYDAKNQTLTTAELADLPDELKLMALADGELSPADQAQLFAKLQEGRTKSQTVDVANAVLQHQSVRQACQRAGEQAFGGGCPDELQAKLRAMAVDTTGDTDAGVSDAQPEALAPVIGRIGPSLVSRWLPSAVAALLLVSALIVFNIDRGISGDGSGAQILSVSTVDRLARRHITCANDPIQMQASGLLTEPAQVDLPKAVTSLMKSDGVSPVSLGLDLIPAGYEFVAVGPCNAPGADSVHLLYRKIGSINSMATMLSVWLQPARVSDAAASLEDNRVYTIDQHGCSPVRVWKQGGMVVYVAAESESDCMMASKAVRGESI